MSSDLQCYRCGASLAQLSLPLSRQDECPSCSNYLHVCRMCRFFDPDVPKKCREDDAEEVIEKERLNFCEWFKPSADSFDAGRAGEEQRAKSELGALFGDTEAEKADSDLLQQQADDLFK